MTHHSGLPLSHGEWALGTVRDSQKGRLYKAEKVLGPLSQRLETTEEMATYLHKVINRAPIQKRYGKFLRAVLEVRPGYRCRSAFGNYNWIKMPKWSRTQYIVLHEFAHSLTQRKYGHGVAGHGREYASIYLDLVRFGMGKEAHATLLASFKEHKVRYRVSGGKAKPVHTVRVKTNVVARK